MVPLLFGSAGSPELLPWAMFDGGLGGRPMFDWSDDELHRLVERWNIGWVWAFHADCIQRWQRFPNAKSIGDYEQGKLFKLERVRGFIVKGRGQYSVLDNGDIVLSELIPEQGEVVLSLRFYRGWSVSPSQVTIEPEIDPYDPLPITRLRMDATVNRVVLQMVK